MAMLGELSCLSLIAAGSSTNAALGDVSAAGDGLPELEVTHSGAGPLAFVAVHPAGKAGGVTPSKFSLNVVTGVHGVGVGVGVSIGVGVGVGTTGALAI